MINLFVRYATKVTAPSTNWPHGEPKPTSAPGAYDGTPWTAALLGTVWGFLEAIVLRSATVITDTVDNAVNSELFDALIAITGSKIRYTTDALTRDLTPISVFSSSDYAVAGDGGGATWRATGITSLPDAGTIDWPNGLLYDLVGTEFVYDSPDITFEAFDLQYADAVAFQVATGKPIILRAGAEYALAGTTLTLGTGATIKGPAIGAASVGTLARFTYTGAGTAIDVSGGAPPREDGLLENFMIQAASGFALNLTNCERFVVRGIQASSGGAGATVYVGGGTGNVLEGLRINKTAAVNNNGIEIGDGTGHIVRDIHYVNNLNQDWTPLAIGATAVGTQISGISYDGQGTQAPIVDGGDGTVFMDGVTLTSMQLNLANGAEQQDGQFVGRGGFINRVRIHYPGPVGVGNVSAALRIGRATAPATVDLDYYLLMTPAPLTNPWATEDISPLVLSAADVDAAHVMTFSTDGAANAGVAKVSVEVLPYRGRV